MLNNLSENIRNCLQHAEDCGRKAAELPNVSPLRQDFLRLEKRWLELARSFEFGESLGTFFALRPRGLWSTVIPTNYAVPYSILSGRLAGAAPPNSRVKRLKAPASWRAVDAERFIPCRLTAFVRINATTHARRPLKIHAVACSR
jgi:hypothetical protein